MFSSVRPVGEPELGDLEEAKFEVLRGGGGPRLLLLLESGVAEVGVSLTMGEYWEMDELPLYAPGASIRGGA